MRCGGQAAALCSLHGPGPEACVSHLRLFFLCRFLLQAKVLFLLTLCTASGYVLKKNYRNYPPDSYFCLLVPLLSWACMVSETN
ncbi:unnamed protein product [Urochloa humidicola]